MDLGVEPWSLTVRSGVMWSDKSYEHRMQNCRPQHREAANHGREYTKRFFQSEIRCLGHFRSGFVVRKNFALRENFDKAMNGSLPPRTDVERRRGAGQRDGSRSALSSAIFVVSQQGRNEAILPDTSLLSKCQMRLSKITPTKSCAPHKKDH